MKKRGYSMHSIRADRDHENVESAYVCLHATAQKAKEASTEFARRLEAALGSAATDGAAPVGTGCTKALPEANPQQPPDLDGKYEEF